MIKSLKWAMLACFERLTGSGTPGRSVANGGLTVGNLIALLTMRTTDGIIRPLTHDEKLSEQEISDAFDSLERDGWIQVHNVKGVKHAVWKENKRR